MQISQMLPSTYLKKEDVPQPVIVTIDHLEEKNVAKKDEPDEFKWIIFFDEFDRGLVLNATNINAIAQACRSTDTDDWTGKEVVLFTDPNVSFGGKVTGGLRIKAHEERPPARPVRPKSPLEQGKPVPAARPASQAHTDQEIPLADMDSDEIPY